MPSEAVEAARDPTADVLAALTPRLDAFHSAIASAEAEIRSEIMRRGGSNRFTGEQARMELGPFASGRIDPDRFAALMGVGERLSDFAVSVIDRADAVLALFSEGTELHTVTVEARGDLRDTVKNTLAHMGQVFGASRAIELARSGTFEAKRHNRLLSKLPFRDWNRAERQLAPPLVVRVRGEDCLPAGLGEFLDGTISIALVVTGPTTPAPLVRLITPGTFVVQTADPADLARMAASAHPGVAIVFDEERPEQARFVHDPDAGSDVWSRLTVTHMPERPQTVGRGRRAPAWVEELEHLEALASRPARAIPGPGDGGQTVVGAPAASPLADAIAPAADRGAADGTVPAGGAVSADGTGPADTTAPADRLAAWLLAQADLGDL